YDGWITIRGNPCLKPFDHIAFSDLRNGLSGPLGVKRVVHRLDGDVGFVTIFSPDCVSTSPAAVQGTRLITAGIASVASKLVTLIALRTAMAGAKAKYRLLKSTVSSDKVYQVLRFQDVEKYLKNPYSVLPEGVDTKEVSKLAERAEKLIKGDSILFQDSSA